ncbi:aspartyl/glutamyl-tRNA amidotransferase subunit C domain protein [Clostridiales bacterium oral taxon 876 str. F0540]|nr:aspartyl/glutamyl-tRNA amidotransferase subunit C domain protein [Clostridiales bacterium oral taxon 876 str. F0540]
MRGDLDMVEDIRVKKNNRWLGNKFLVGLIAFLIFVIFCGLFFNATYMMSTKTVNSIDKKMDQLNKNDKDSTRKTYYIEQKLRRDLENMTKNQK